MKVNKFNKINRKYSEGELKLLDNIHQAHIYGIIFIIAAFIIPPLAAATVNSLVNDSFTVYGSQFMFCLAAACPFIIFALILFGVAAINKVYLKKYGSKTDKE